MDEADEGWSDIQMINNMKYAGELAWFNATRLKSCCVINDPTAMSSGF